MDDKGCKCQGCGKHYKVDFLVNDMPWEDIKPPGKPVGAGLLCGECIVKAIEGKNNFATYRISSV